jgi:hypothetical protein
LGAGRSVNASPVPQIQQAVDQALTSVGGVTDEQHQIDLFTLASGGAQDLTLTYVPAEDSWNVSLNGITATTGVDYTISSSTLSLLSPLDARTSDVVEVQYDYLTGLPATPTADAGNYPAEVMLDAPIAYWRLDEASGTSVADFTGNGHTGTTNAGSGTVTRATTTLLTAGNGGVRSTKFEDYGARVNVPNSSAIDTSAFTIEFLTSKGGSTFCPIWHHPGRMRVLMAGSAINVYFWVSGAWQHVHQFTGLAGSDDVVNHHVSLSFDGSSTWASRIDGGADSGTVISTATLPSATAGPEFGDGADGVNNGSAFRLQEFAYYGYALSAARNAAHVAVR